ncbi:MAG: glycine betaine/L-proline ABC transporter ATP-binding protein [Hyphomicrobiaceae bacterium]|nr:glycine betaine/L-proline ABC transporter ATP-binding protein [Hyphomicrobiaceae bacterium]
MALVDIRNVTKIFGRDPKAALKRVKDGHDKDRLLAETGHTLGLNNVSMAIEEGEIFVVMGLSGSGKSTLIRHLNRLIDPTDGEILVRGEDVMKLSVKELELFRRKTMSMVFQRFALLPHRTVRENVAYGLEISGVGKDERLRTADEWIETVGLSGYGDQYPNQLSGGMQQRVGLARALATNADILLMDEAFSALDPLIRSQMQDQLLELQSKLGKTIIFITHDLDEALRIGDRIAILKDGVVSQIGTPAEILMAPADDYVAEFVRDVNRARVLSVDVVMEPPELRFTTENLDAALAAMRKVGTQYGFIDNEKGYRGLVTRERIEEAVASQEPEQPLEGYVEEPYSVALDSTIEAALPVVLEAGHPVAVLDAEGKLAGVVTPGSFGEVLAAPEEDAA